MASPRKMLWLLTGIVYVTKFLFAHGTTCSDAYSCVDDDLADLSEELVCSGYSSCRGLDEISTQDGLSVSCEGSYSCFGTNILNSNSTLTCDASYSCSNIDSITTLDTIYCYGDKSCQGSNIEFSSNTEESNSQVYCYGDHSCSNTTIKASVIEVDGIGGLTNSIVENSDDSLIIFLNSYYAGYGLTVKCTGIDTSCEIICHSNGCVGVTFECDSGTNCNVICDDSERNNLCPYGYDSVFTVTNDIDSYILLNNNNWYISSNIYGENADKCNGSIAIVEDNDCLNAQGCEDSSSLLSGNSDEIICCSGTQSCYDAPIITSVEDAPIYCNGLQSCQEIVSIRFNPNGNAYCGARLSCDTTYLGLSEAADTRSGTNVYCGGYFSCSNTELDDVEVVTCGGRNSCYDSDITIVDILFGFGRSSLESTDISNITKSVYCNGYRACYSSTINYIDENIYANGYQSLSFSTITVVKNSIYAYGYQSLAYSTVNNVTNTIHCVGELSCSQSTLTEMSSLVASGENALDGTTIIGPEYGDLLTVSISNDNTGDETFIHCNYTKYCILYCQSSHACSKVTFYCPYDSCSTTCNQNAGIECPNIIEIAPATTPAPTICEDVLVNEDVQTGISVTVVVLLAIANGIVGLIWITDRRKHKAHLKNITKGVELHFDEEEQSEVKPQY